MAEPLLKEKPLGECICQLSQSAKSDSRAQPSPPVAADSAAGRRAGEARPKGKYSSGRMALAPIRARRIFPATGHKTAVPPSSLISLTFTSQTGSLLLSSLKKVTSPLVPSFLPLVTPSQPARPRTCRACAPWSGRSARPRRPRWSAHSGWDQNPSPWP